MDEYKREKLEIELLCSGIYDAYGYDFRQYAKASFTRRINQFVSDNGYSSITRLLAEILHNEDLIHTLIKSISVTTSDMFRDPHIFKLIRATVIPYLKTFPNIRIWHAACGRGEEVFSMAIMLKEEKIYDNCTIYATDMNDAALESVQKGIYHISRIKDFTGNYIKSGGRSSLSDYYHAKYNNVKFDNKLLENVTFANHNLSVDSIFLEANLILCRNAMIYFDSNLQKRVLNLLDGSLSNGGILCIGSKESLVGTELAHNYKSLSDGMKIYKKVPGYA